MRQKLLHKNSIMNRVLFLMLSALIVMFIILYCAIFLGGMTGLLKQNAFDILSERVENRKNNLQSDMLQRWSALNDHALSVEEDVKKVLARNGAAYGDLTAASPLADEALSAVMERLIYLMRRNSVSGVFVAFNGGQSTDPPAEGEAQLRAALYIRDYEPESDPDNYSDLTLECAPTAIVRSSGITLDSYWRPTLSFTGGAEASDFYFKPFQAALRWQEAGREDLGYWCPAFTFQSGSTRVITYSVPLLDDAGVPFGVMGIELTEDYLLSKLPYSEISSGNQGSYLLAVNRENGPEFTDVVASGPYYQRIFGGSYSSVRLKKIAGDEIHEVDTGGRIDGRVYGCVKNLQLYNTNTPFEADRWVLVGVVEEQYLLGLYNRICAFLIVILVGTFLLGAATVVAVTRRFSRPITRLALRVRDSDPRRPVSLDKINVAEIDELSTAIEHLSRRVAESYSKLSEILQVADFRIGAFEFNRENGELFYTDGFLEVVGQEERQRSPDTPLNAEEFRAMFEELGRYAEERPDKNVIVYRLPLDGGNRWVRFSLVSDQRRFLGVLSDVTAEYTERRKIEYERDYDLLTSLLNRRAFHRMVERLFEEETLTVAAAVMLDLDNLKYINDTYGHDCGDQYIWQAASVLQKHTSDHAVAARMSGDEFYFFLYGGSREEIAQEIRSLEQDYRRAELELPDGQRMRIRISGGIAWYPKDSRSYRQLLRYADFAMYRVKHTTKGQFAEFDLASYRQEGFLLHNKEELNRLIDGELVEYAFQPIVSAADGSVFAYEALMRPVSTAFRNPLDVLAVARSQSKLYQIERLTWFKALEAFSRQNPPDGSVRLFLNSIPNQILAESDMAQFERIYTAYLSRLVVELTEEEKPDDSLTRRKWESIRQWGAEIALDDYGSGYNGEAMLLSVAPGFLKIDREIISRVDQDASRQQMLSNIAGYAAAHSISVVAEGIETRAELETAIACGAQYLQGYYLGKPEKLLADIPVSVVREIRAAQKR